MVLADVEHCCAEVKLVEELRDEDVHLQHVSHVFPLNIPEKYHLRNSFLLIIIYKMQHSQCFIKR